MQALIVFRDFPEEVYESVETSGDFESGPIVSADFTSSSDLSSSGSVDSMILLIPLNHLIWLVQLARLILVFHYVCRHIYTVSYGFGTDYQLFPGQLNFLVFIVCIT